MKPSWKLRALGAEAAAIVAAAPSLREAARQLGVNVSTISRHVKAGRLPTPGRRPASVDTKGRQPKRDRRGTFIEWACSRYEFSRAELEIVVNAQAALDLAGAKSQPAAVRLSAMREYRACLRDLKLPPDVEEGGDEHGEVAAENVRPFRARNSR